MDETDYGLAPLCELCRSSMIRSLMKHEEKAYRAKNIWTEHHADFPSLQRSWDVKCFICRSIDSDESHFQRSSLLLMNRDLSPIPRGFMLTYSVSGRSSSGYCFEVLMKEWPGSDRDVTGVVECARNATNTADPRVSRLIHQWFTNCLEHHDACRKNVSPEWYPRRLLRIENERIRLVHVAEEQINRPYATASHCWGVSEFPFLTKQNIATFILGMEISKLPQTFQDIVATARRLDILYLWIDYYCIIQSEGHDDKLAELREMDRIFENAILNIGATSASSPFDGCLIERDPISPLYASISWRYTHSDTEQRCFLINAAIQAPWANLFNSPVLSRAWVFQERLLCPRMLHLASPQIYWECCELLPACESMPFGMQGSGTGFGTWDEYRNIPFSVGMQQQIMSDIESAITTANNILDFSWAQVVQQYSAMQLSRPQEDKLFALAAIAKRVSLLMGFEYTAGFMHKHDLVDHLDWYIHRPEPADVKHTRPSQWRAPSWSWASVDSPVHVLGSKSKFATFVDVKVEPVDPSNKFGAIKSASLRLRARLLRFSMDASGVKFPNLFDGHPNIPTYKPSFDDDRDAGAGFFLPMSEGWREVRGLLLKPGLASGSYHRIGIMTVSSPSSEQFNQFLADAGKEKIITLL